MTGVPVEGTCIERPHNHVGICYRRGLADGFAQGQALGPEPRHYSAAADPRVEAVLDVMVASMITASRERHAEDFSAAIEATNEAQSKLHHAIYNLAEALIRDGAAS